MHQISHDHPAVASKSTAARLFQVDTPAGAYAGRNREEPIRAADSLTAAEVREELHRVLNSAQFITSNRNRRFLQYVVDETLAGRADRLKAYTIATMVFGRPDSFDPQTDPVVRMEARRLRQALERFYLVDPSPGRTGISMPKGSYVPDFNGSGHTAEKARLPSSGPAAHEIAVLVAGFEAETMHEARCNLHLGLTRQLGIRLNDLGVSVACSSTGSPLAGTANCWPEHVLSGNLAWVGEQLTATALLTLAETGRVVWGQTFRKSSSAEEVLAARDDLAGRIALAVQAVIESHALRQGGA